MVDAFARLHEMLPIICARMNIIPPSEIKGCEQRYACLEGKGLTRQLRVWRLGVRAVARDLREPGQHLVTWDPHVVKGSPCTTFEVSIVHFA